MTAVATARAASAAPLTVLDATGAEAGPVGGTTAPGSGITPAHELRARLDTSGRRRAGAPACAYRPRRPRRAARLLRPDVAVLPADGTPDAALAALLPSDVSRVEPTADPAWLGRRLARASVRHRVGRREGVGARRCAAQLAAGRLRPGRGRREQYRRLESGMDGVGARGGHRRTAAAGPLRRGRRAGHVARGGADGTAVMARLARERPRTPHSPTWQCR